MGDRLEAEDSERLSALASNVGDQVTRRHCQLLREKSPTYFSKSLFSFIFFQLRLHELDSDVGQIREESLLSKKAKPKSVVHPALSSPLAAARRYRFQETLSK